MPDDASLIPAESALAMTVAGAVANRYAARGLFADYRARKAINTIKRHDDALALFARALSQAGIADAPAVEELGSDPAAWIGVTWGLVSYFVQWLLRHGYAVGTVNGHLSIVKSYAKLAAQAGAISTGEYALIRAISGYRGAEAKHLDEGRAMARAGHKKALPVSLTRAQARRLREQPDTAQGRRDAVLLGLMLDLGLRCGEVAGIKVTDINLSDATLTFYRDKVGKVQTHALTNGLLKAIQAYIAQDAPSIGPLLRASRKGGDLAAAGMSERAITDRVRELGERIGAVGLSAHDLRHHWATTAARCGTPIDRLQDAGGWSSPAMPLRYVEAAKIANQGVRLD